MLDVQRDIKLQLELIGGSIVKKPRTPYIGWLGHNNLGDEILYKAHLALFPELNLLEFYKSNLVELYYKLTNRYENKIGVLGGGTFIFQSNYWLLPIKYLLSRDYKMFCLGTGVASGNFLLKQSGFWEDNRKEWLNALSAFSFVGVRGPYSKKDLDDIGLEGSVVVGDTALSLSSDSFVKKDIKRIIGINYGINEMQTTWGNDTHYKNEVINLIKNLIYQGFTIHILPVFSEDIQSNIEICRAINNKNCKLKINYMSYEAYSSELQKCDIFIGQKLHSTIMACMNRIPSIMIEYNPKCRDFMASINMERYTLTSSEFSQNKTNSLIEEIYNNYSNIQQGLNNEVLKYKKLQFKYANLIKDKLII